MDSARIADGAAVCDVRAALARGVAALTAASVDSPALAAELLLMHVLGRDRAWLYAHPECALDARQLADYRGLLERRAAGVPTQYLTGTQEFWGLEFEVTRDVLIPRPETEHLVEVALERLGARREETLRIADVGTGSGCLAVALAKECPRARVTATDISPAALLVAARNAARHGVAERVEFREMNLLSSLLPALRLPEGSRFDLIVSNPPYVARNEEAQLQREVRDHEPAQALYGGADGLDLYPALVSEAGSLLEAGGIFVVEVGHGAADCVRSLFQDEAWTEVAVTPDLAGIPRVLSAQRVSSDGK